MFVVSREELLSNSDWLLAVWLQADLIGDQGCLIEGVAILHDWYVLDVERLIVGTVSAWELWCWVIVL